jgi:hypothetical protein
MAAQRTVDKRNLYSLILLEDFKAVLDIDDREDKLARFCLVTGTFTIEQYCKQRLLRKTIHQVFRVWGDLTLFLSEYPVREILAVSVLENSEILEPELYSLEPPDEIENIPCQLILSPALKRMRSITALKVIYKAG